MQKFFRVTYKGLWLGGAAIVVARDAEEAKALVRDDRMTYGFTDVSVKEVKGPVLYNDNGDY